MHSLPAIPFWKKAPFIRMLIPLLIGIILQWYFPVPFICLIILICSLTAIIILFLFLPIPTLFAYKLLPGYVLNLLLITGGMFLVYLHFSPNNSYWVGHYNTDSSFVVATLEEPLQEKEKTFKAIARVSAIITGNTIRKATGHILLYFKKDFSPSSTNYGTTICFTKPLQPIQSTGNPGAFEYKQYAAFQDTYFQVYLEEDDWMVLTNTNSARFKKFLSNSRQKLISILRSHIKGNKEVGLAEAMLIGYKNDLDKDLVQAYSNTGVVHVIAISGLHLGLLYWLLKQLLRPLRRFKKVSWLNPLIIIGCLWLFSFLTGGSPSVLRSALMFTCLITGESMAKKTSVYNSLAASAFLLLCYNPFWVWDVGFQLSYIAVLSIVIFYKPFYTLLFFSNKLIDAIWKLVVVTIAAQILTTPVSIYHFHQFPLLFLISNLVAVPLSSIILLGELVLCAISFIPVLSTLTGWILQQLLVGLNFFIEKINTLDYAVLHNLHISIVQLLFLYSAVAAFSFALFTKNKKAILITLCCLFCFVSLRTLSFFESSYQRKIIIYNIPKYQAIDFISGRNYVFYGDTVLLKNNYLKNFYLTPSRIVHRCTSTGTLNGSIPEAPLFVFENTRILLIDSTWNGSAATYKPTVDFVILSKNPRISIHEMLAVLDCKQIVFDHSNASWRIQGWKKECAEAGIPCHDVSAKGAFVIKLP